MSQTQPFAPEVANQRSGTGEADVDPVAVQRGVGIVTPFDFALDRELWRWVPPSVTLHTTRVPFVPTAVTAGMAVSVSADDLVRRATRDVLVPEPAVVAYACASGSFIRGATGEKALRRAIRQAGAPAAVTTSGALISALRALDVHRLTVVTPYDDELTSCLVSFLASYGIETVTAAGMGLLRHIWRVPYADIVAQVRAAHTDAAEAVFISCTNLPTYDIIAPLEAETGRPVLTANQVTVWAVLRELGLSATGPGRLVEHDPAGPPARIPLQRRADGKG